MIAGVFELCGARGGDTVPGNRYNKKGFFENKQIRDACVKPILKELNADPLGQKSFPTYPIIKQFPHIRETVESILRDQDVTGAWYYKEPKLLLIHNVWRAAFPDALWIICVRPKKAVINSVGRTGFFSNLRDIEHWYSVYLNQVNSLIHAGAIIIDTDAVVNGDLFILKSAINVSGLVWNESALEFIDKSMYSTEKE